MTVLGDELANDAIDVAQGRAAVVLVKAGDHLGSGFFVGSEGLLLTNAHVVEGASRVSIHTADAESFLATVLSLSKDHDLALLRVSARPTASLRLGRSETVVVGTDIFAIGSPKGLEGTVTKGIVSAVRKFESSTFLQIDAAINSGNSGGPLVTETREVIGINTMKRKGAEQLGFAIAIDDVKKDSLRTFFDNRSRRTGDRRVAAVRQPAADRARPSCTLLIPARHGRRLICDAVAQLSRPCWSTSRGRKASGTYGVSSRVRAPASFGSSFLDDAPYDL